jgi:hypothetical protein
LYLGPISLTFTSTLTFLLGPNRTCVFYDIFTPNKIISSAMQYMCSVSGNEFFNEVLDFFILFCFEFCCPSHQLQSCTVACMTMQYLLYSWTLPVHRTSLPRGQHFCFIFGRSQVQISGRRPAILTKAFRSFLSYLQANAGIVGLP